MAIDLKHNQYSAQFNAFVQFAKNKDLTQDTLVRIDASETGPGFLGPNGAPRKIVVKEGDEIKGVTNPFFFRSQTNKDLNFEVRELFLKTILNVCNVYDVDKLPPAVRAVLNKDDFGKAGHPLSVRRIRAITDAVLETARAEEAAAGKIEAASVNTKPAEVKVEVPVEEKIIEIKEEPKEEPKNVKIIEVADELKSEEELSLDNPLERKYNRRIPVFAVTYPIDILEVFMPYYAKTKKYQLDPGIQVLPQLFEACVKNDRDRKLLAELLANDKINVYSSDGKALLKDNLLEPVIKEASTIIGMMNKFREANGDAMYEILLSELKSIKWGISTKELEKLIKDCDKLAVCAKGFHIDNMNWNWTKFHSYQANETLEKFKGEVDNWFEEECPEKFPDEAENDPEPIAEIKKHLFIALAVKQSERLAEMAKSFDNLREKLVAEKSHNDLLPLFEQFFKGIDIDD